MCGWQFLETQLFVVFILGINRRTERDETVFKDVSYILIRIILKLVVMAPIFVIIAIKNNLWSYISKQTYRFPKRILFET